MDSSTVAVNIQEFRHIVGTNQGYNYKDSIIVKKDEQIASLLTIIKNDSTIFKQKDDNISSLKNYIELNEPFFLDHFWVGVVTTVLLIAGGVLLF